MFPRGQKKKKKKKKEEEEKEEEKEKKKKLDSGKKVRISLCRMFVLCGFVH